MFKYRVLNLEEKQLFKEEEETFLKPNGTLVVNGEVFEGKFEVQPLISLANPNQPEIYIGDVVSFTFEDDGKEPNYLDHLLSFKLHCLPKEKSYDELLFKFVQDEHNEMYYWLMFKSNGEFIKNNACNMPDETEPNEIRAIPTDSTWLLKRLSEYGSFKVMKNHTEEHWNILI